LVVLTEVWDIQTEYKNAFLTRIESVANFGYDQLSGRGYGNTDAAII
jgi:iron complex outermembrane receptor protein